MPGRKTSKPISKRQQAIDDYKAWMFKHEQERQKNLARLKKVMKPTKVVAAEPRERVSSYSPGVGAKKDTLMYTGDNMLGIAAMHKSNEVPIFNFEHAQDVAKMRR